MILKGSGDSYRNLGEMLYDVVFGLRQVDIAGAGPYAVLVRYEGLATHDSAFRVVVEQAGAVVYNRVFGRLTNWKMWAFAGSRIAGSQGP